MFRQPSLYDDTYAVVAIPHRVTPYPWGALWFVGSDPDGRAGDMIDQRVDGARRRGER